MKNKNSRFICRFVIVFVSSLIVAGCGTQVQTIQSSETSQPSQEHDMSEMEHMAHDVDPGRYAGRKNAVTKISENGNYRITLFSNESPVPVQKIHTWTVHIETKTGKAFDDGKVYVNGGMPMHRHGLPTKPKAKKYLGNGDYQVDGVKFNMHGHWELRFNIQSGRDTDRIVFKVNLQSAESVLSQQWSKQELATIRSLWIDNLPTLLANSGNRVADNADAAEFGQKIFFDKRFSANGRVACASCHKPELYFTDGLKVSQGIGTAKRNSPTIVGASYSAWFFRDGRADSLWSQALEPLEDRQEHGGSRSQYAQIIYNDPAYRASYEKLFGAMPDLSDKARFPAYAGPVKSRRLLKAWKSMSDKDQKAVTLVFVNFAKAIAAYERLLKAAPSRFDNYVKAIVNSDNAKMNQLMSVDELAGLKLFVSKANCMICHNGPMLTDFSFHNIATPPTSTKRYDWGRNKGARKVKKSEFNCRGEYNDTKNKQCPELDYIVFHKEETAAAFKTPSLRNVSKTAPYMHAGQYKTLSDVMKHYADPPSTKVGTSDLLPVKLNKTELAQLEAFLLTLDSPVDANLKLLRAP